MPMKDSALNCEAQRVIEHFEKAKRGYGLTSTRKQKIGIWEKRMCQPGARVEDVAELEKILKRLITLHAITHGVIFNTVVPLYSHLLYSHSPSLVTHCLGPNLFHKKISLL